MAAPEARICHERAEPLCRSLNHPRLLAIAIRGQWRYALMADKLTAAKEIAERVYSLAQQQNDTALMIAAYNTLACTLTFLGDFESGRQYAMRGVQIWRLGGAQSYVEEFHVPVVGCLIYGATCEWHLGEIARCHAMMEEGISIAKELKDMNALAVALNWAANIAYNERNRAEVERLASDLIELSARHNFVHFLNLGAINRGWARSASGETAEGIPAIEQGIRDVRATGTVVGMPIYLARKAEALHLADRTSEALEAINEAETLAERFEQRIFCAELYRLRGVFLAAMGAEETQIETSFAEAIKIAKKQKAVSLEKRAKASYAEYRRQKASGSGESRFRIPLW